MFNEINMYLFKSSHKLSDSAWNSSAVGLKEHIKVANTDPVKDFVKFSSEIRIYVKEHEKF